MDEAVQERDEADEPLGGAGRRGRRLVRPSGLTGGHTGSQLIARVRWQNRR